jgi:anti-sigma factor RsiW
MRCDEVRERLNAFRDGALEPAERPEIAQHLEACSACRAALARLERLGSLLTETALPPVPVGFAERLVAAAARRQAARTVRGPLGWWRSVSGLQRVAVAAVLALGVGLGLLAGGQTTRSAPLQPPQADPVATYRLDHLMGAPPNSIPAAYVKLASAEVGRRE